MFFPEKPEPVVYEVQPSIVSGELVRVNVTPQIYITYPRTKVHIDGSET